MQHAVVVADGESDNSSPPSIFDFGDGLKMNGATVQKLFQFQVTGKLDRFQIPPNVSSLSQRFHVLKLEYLPKYMA